MTNTNETDSRIGTFMSGPQTISEVATATIQAGIDLGTESPKIDRIVGTEEEFDMPAGALTDLFFHYSDDRLKSLRIVAKAALTDAELRRRSGLVGQDLVDALNRIVACVEYVRDLRDQVGF